MEYKPGSDSALVAAISDLEIIDETKLTWSQVREVRKDKNSKTKLRKMRNWIDTEFSGKSVREVSDGISVRLEDYNWSIKKHGIETVTGTISELLDPKLLSATTVAATGLSLAAGEFWAGVGAAGILVTRAAVSVTQKLIDLKDRKRGQGSEVAFVHEIAKLAKK